MQVGDKVSVWDWGLAPGRKFIGYGIIREICTLPPHMVGPVACVAVAGEPGRYLREIGELTPA